MPGEPIGGEPLSKLSVHASGYHRIAGPHPVGVGELVVETIDTQRAEQDLISGTDPIRWRCGYTRQRCASTECVGGFPRPETADDVGTITQYIVNLLSAPQLDARVLVLVLQAGKLILNLGFSGYGTDGDNQVLRAKRPLSLGELLDRYAQVRRRKYIVLLALNDRALTIGASPRQVDAVLRLAAAEPVKLGGTSGGAVVVWCLLVLDDRGGLVDPCCGGQGWWCGAAVDEPSRVSCTSQFV